MSHQPFENWILDVDTLPKDERHTLEEHLASCSQCQQLQRNWQSVNHELRAKSMVAPAQGFTQRWQAGLAERRAREMQRQAWKIFLSFSGGSFFVLLGMVTFLLTFSSPAELMAVLIRNAAEMANFFSNLVAAVRFWFSATPPALNVALWIYLTITLCLMSLGWVFAIWRTAIIGVQNK
jgi:anti-sigma factor RsiW